MGRASPFSGSGGASIYWTPVTGAHAVQGAIRATWASLGWERGPLGYPVSDELAVRASSARTSTFTGGVIVWTPAIGAHEVHGAILVGYAAAGGPAGRLGAPTTDETAVPAGAAAPSRAGTPTGPPPPGG